MNKSESLSDMALHRETEPGSPLIMWGKRRRCRMSRDLNQRAQKINKNVPNSINYDIS